MHAKELQLHSTFCDMDCSPPGSSVHGISQARIPEWVACPPPGDLLKHRDRTCLLGLLHWQVGSLPLASTWEAHTPSQCLRLKPASLDIFRVNRKQQGPGSALSGPLSSSQPPDPQLPALSFLWPPGGGSRQEGRKLGFTKRDCGHLAGPAWVSAFASANWGCGKVFGLDQPFRP